MTLAPLCSLLLVAASPTPAPAPRPDAIAASHQAEALMQRGDARGALPLYRQAWDGGLHAEPMSYDAACAAARLGQTDEAFGWLERALDGQLMDLKLLQDDEDLVPLRKD